VAPLALPTWTRANAVTFGVSSAVSIGGQSMRFADQLAAISTPGTYDRAALATEAGNLPTLTDKEVLAAAVRTARESRVEPKLARDSSLIIAFSFGSGFLDGEGPCCHPLSSGPTLESKT
jgi:hypothetical protein